MNGGGFHQGSEVLVDHLFLGVVWLRKAMQKHYRGGEVLASPSELWGTIPPIHDVALDLAGVTPGVTRRVMRMGRSVVHQARRHMWQLVLPPSS